MYLHTHNFVNVNTLILRCDLVVYSLLSTQDETEFGGNISLLKESDFISFFDQFPFTDLYKYILTIPPGGMWSVRCEVKVQIVRLV